MEEKDPAYKDLKAIMEEMKQCFEFPSNTILEISDYEKNILN
jgi:hypothetical protein